MTLRKYVLENAVRGSCTCGKCLDAPETSTKPAGHTVNLTVFEVAAKAGANREDFLALVRAEHPEYLDGAEHSYLQVGADMGDQGVGLTLIGLGHLLGAWAALSPDTMLGDAVPRDTKLQMAGAGYVTLQAAKPTSA